MNPTYTLTDEMGNTFVWTFDLTGEPGRRPARRVRASSGYSKSYISLVGFEMREIEDGHHHRRWHYPRSTWRRFDAAGSEAIELLNPMLQFPTPDTNVRRYPTVTARADRRLRRPDPDEFNTAHPGSRHGLALVLA
jgi:hypothetical protein